LKKRSRKYSSTLELLLLIAVLLVVNWLSTFFYSRLDLTQEKRFTLSKTTAILAGNLDDQLSCKIYLEGNLPANYKRLKIAITDYLNELNQKAKIPVTYTFVDPLEGLNEAAKRDVVNQFLEKGLAPKNVKVQGDNQMSYQVVFPCASFYFNGKEITVNFMRNEVYDDENENSGDINTAVENIEFEICNVLRKCTTKQKRKLAFLIGHGELNKYETGDILAELTDFYQVERVDMTEVTLGRLKEYAGIVIARPTEKFSEYDKYKLDQYVMNGGKLLWFIDPMIADMDSTRNAKLSFTSIPFDLNLDDQLFKYGVRINNDLIQDLSCNVTPILANTSTGKGNRTLVNWIFYPLLGSQSKHPIVKNMDFVWGQFTSSMDLTASTRVNKTVLLQSSPRSRTLSSPALVDLKILNEKIVTSNFNRGDNPVAVLLEGSFESVFAHRKVNDTVSQELKFVENIENNKMIIVSDGDIIRNQVSKGSGQVYPLGFDRYSGQTFGNKKFVLNCIDYLCDDSGIIELRNREIALRLLNKDKVKEERTQWQLINILVPILIVIIFGFVNVAVRKRKYAG
jgi:ABC-2 type transport system permease protein